MNIEVDLCLNLNLNKILMEAPLTDYQESYPSHLQKFLNDFPTKAPSTIETASQNLLDKIFTTLNSPRNHRDYKPHKMSVSIQETNPPAATKCNCKKSKCLKLYCECFAQGLYCNGCNCACCQNNEQFSEIRAKAIDDVLLKSTIPFGHKNSSIKGCNCKKTECLKKYCECYGSGNKCSEYCKCSNCQNS